MALKRVGNVAYELELPSSLRSAHPIFYVSMLQKFIGNPSLVVPLEDVGISDSLSYEEVPMRVLDWEVRLL